MAATTGGAEITPPTDALKRLLEKVFDRAQDGLRREVGSAEYERRRHDFAFHMTDWLRDLDGLVDLAHRPEAYDAKRATPFVIGFLYHVIPHLNAAGRLLLDEIPDHFADG